MEGIMEAASRTLSPSRKWRVVKHWLSVNVRIASVCLRWDSERRRRFQSVQRCSRTSSLHFSMFLLCCSKNCSSTSWNAIECQKGCGVYTEEPSVLLRGSRSRAQLLQLFACRLSPNIAKSILTRHCSKAFSPYWRLAERSFSFS